MKSRIAKMISLLGLKSPFVVVVILLFVAAFFVRSSEETLENWQGSLAFVSYPVQIFLLLLLLIRWSIRKKQTILANLFIFLELIVMVELVFFFLIGSPDLRFLEHEEIPLADGEVAKELGLFPLKDSVRHEVKMHEGDTAFDVHYSVDEYYKRITPVVSDSADKHAIFWGCSIAYGFGLEDNQTMPYYFQEAAPDYHAYNFGYNGFGMHQMLARLEFGDIPEQVAQKDGIGIYVFYWGHMSRVIGRMDMYNKYGWCSPYYEKTDNGVERKGTFKNGREGVSRWYEWLWRSSTMKYFKVNLPMTLNESHVELAAAIVKQSKEEYQKQFPGSEFYVAYFPNWKDKEEAKLKQSVLSKLEDAGLKVLDLGADRRLRLENTIPGDYHPNAELNKELALELSTWIQNQP